MPYNLCMSPEQIARCNRALGSNELSTVTIQHEWPGCMIIQNVDVVLQDAAGIRKVLAALRDNPEDLGPDDNTLEWINLTGLENALCLTLQSPEGDGMLQGICV